MEGPWAIHKKNQTGRVEDILFYFTLGNFRQNKASPLEIPKNFVISLGNSKVKNQDPWKFHIICSWSTLEVPLRF